MSNDSAPIKKPPGFITLVISVVYPCFVIGFEFFTGMYAEAFFDPLPTLFHLALVALVPIANFLIWHKLRVGNVIPPSTLLFVSAVAITIAAYYTLIFLPLLPISIIAIFIYGMGLLSIAPLVSLVSAIRLYRSLLNAHVVLHKANLLKGFASAIAILLVLDLPPAATYVGISMILSSDKITQNKGIKLLRILRDDDLLLRLSYDGNRRATGLISFGALMLGEHNHLSPSKAREIYFRVTGEPFNTRPVPYNGQSWSRIDAFRFDNDRGGADVGGRVQGLHLASSTIDGSISGDDGVAYLEWVLEFKNSSARTQEARVELALPPEGLVSRASLWVNGEEREAAYAGRAQVRQAYQKVVQRQRDPLLVTTTGPDRVLAQAFPISPNGGTIKFKIGITAPLELKTLDTASLVMPAIVDRNFSFTKNFKHKLWIESKTAIDYNVNGIDMQAITPNSYRVTGDINDKTLSGSRNLITIARDANHLQQFSQYRKQDVILQQIEKNASPPINNVVIVVDGSIQSGNSVDDIIAALTDIPPGVHVGLAIAAEEMPTIDIAPYSQKQKQTILQALKRHHFAGGQDNTHALLWALKQLEPLENAALLWVHHPQPIVFEGSEATLEQASTRLLRLPKIALYSLRTGPNKILTSTKFILNTTRVPNLGATKSDLQAYFDKIFKVSIDYNFQRTRLPNAPVDIKASQHIARLWARDTIHSLVERKKIDNAIELAADYRLVTLVSGAVVLENASQFKDNNLQAVEKNTVPTIPEPSQWLLAIITCIFLLWFLKHNNAQLARRI